MTETPPSLQDSAQEDEQKIVEQMKVLEDLIQTKGWKNYETVLRMQLATRMRILRTPLHEIPAPQGILDGVTRMAQLETVKGAIIGIELCLNLPHATIEHGKQILAERRKASGKETSDE